MISQEFGPTELFCVFSEKSLGGGVVPDIGIYALNFILMVMGDEMPVETKTFGKLNDEVN